MKNEIAMLCSKDVEALRALANEIEKTFHMVQVHRTRTEMEVSVLNDLKHPTPASKYWQAVREQNGMAQGVAMMSFDYRAIVVKIKILHRRLSEESDDLKRELLQIKIDRKEYQLKDMARAAKAKVREIRDWSAIKEREAKNMLPWELEDVDNHQLVSYTRRWVNQTLEMGGGGSPSERQNLIGQLKAGMHRCEEKGMLLTALSVYDPETRVNLINMSKEA